MSTSARVLLAATSALIACTSTSEEGRTDAAPVAFAEVE